MNKEWIAGTEGQNLKFKRETLLNYGMNRWGLNKAYSVGSTSELIRVCAPKTFDEWEDFYFNNAQQKKKNGVRITRGIGTGEQDRVGVAEIARDKAYRKLADRYCFEMYQIPYFDAEATAPADCHTLHVPQTR
jgi:MjaI restriction endonuclease